MVTWWELTHFERPWCWERPKAGGEGDDREWDGWMASLTQWTWVWVNTWSWWWTGGPGMLQFMESQSWTQLSNWTELKDFMILGFVFWSLIHFECLFGYGIRKCSNFTPLHVVAQFSHHQLFKRLSFFHHIFLSPLWSMNWLSVHGLISRLSVLYNWSMYLFLHQYPSVLNTPAMKYSLMLASMISPVLFSSLKFALAIWGPFVGPYKFYIYSVQVCEICFGCFDRDCIKSVDFSGYYEHLHNINSSSLWTWDIFPLFCVMFNFQF